MAIVMDNFSPHLSTKTDQRVGQWAAGNNVELAYVPTNASFLNRIECQFTALRYLDGTDHRSHEEQNSMIRGYIAWRNRHTGQIKNFVTSQSAQRLPYAALLGRLDASIFSGTISLGRQRLAQTFDRTEGRLLRLC
jgi:hypothetical protein